MDHVHEKTTISPPGSRHSDEISTDSSSEHHFEPIRTRKTRDTIDYEADEVNRPELARLATLLSAARSRASTAGDGAALQRADTVTAMAPESPEFDPNSPKFNFFLWMRSRLPPEGQMSFL